MVQPIFPSVKPSGISAVPEDFTALLKRLYPDKLQPLSTARQDLFYTKYQEYGGILDIPTWTLAGAPLHPEDEFNYLVDLPSRATLKEGETILRGLNIPETGIDEFYGIETRQNELETLVKKTFPQYNLEGFTKWTESFETSPENWGKFINTIQTGGWTKDKEDLLHLFDFTTEAINEMLPSPQISPPTAAFEAEWMNVKTGEYITSTELHRRYPKGYEAELDLWKRSPEQVRETVKALPATLTIFGQALTKVPKQVGASILQAIQGQGGASVVDKDWADRFIEEAGTDIGTFVKEIQEKYPERGGLIKYEDLAQLPQNISYSLTSMGAGLAAGIPTALIPLPGMRVAAWALGTAASGAVAYSMTTYQIMQQYLEAKNEESIATKGRGITLQEENQLKADFESKARKYGLWEAVPEAISNLAFAKLLTTPLTKMVGRTIATKIVGKLVGIYGEEILTETITQKGQSDIEVEAGLREGRLTLVEAFKEIAPQTFLLTTIMGGAGQVGVSGYNRVKASLKTEVGETHPLYQTLVTALRDETGGLKLPKGKPEVPTVPEKPALVAQPSQEWSRLSTSNRVKLIQSIPVEERTKIGLTTGDANVAWNKLSPEKKQAIRSKIVLTIPEKVIAKQPWQMTYREFYPIAGSEYTSGERFGIPTVNKVPAQPGTKFGEKGATPEERIHRAILRKALSEGKPVPAEVLKDYPDLKPAPTPTTGAVVEPTAKVTPTPEVTTYKKGQTVEWWDGRAGGKWVEGKINSVDIEADRVNITSGGKKFNVNIGNMLRAKAEAAIPKAPAPEVTKKAISLPQSVIFNGELWHGTNEEDATQLLKTKKFKKSKYSSEELGLTAEFGEGAYFDINYENAQRYGDTIIKSKTKSPLVLYEAQSLEDKGFVQENWSKLQAQGYDGAIFRKGNLADNEIVIFSTDKISPLYDVGQSSAEDAYKLSNTITEPPAIPKAEEGMPEAGYQPAMIEGVTEKEVRPAGKGKIVQISMEDQLKLEQARKAAEEAAPDVKEAYEAQAELEGLKAWLSTEPAAKLVNLLKKTGWNKGEVGNLTLKQYRDITGKTEIQPNILTPDKKHVRWEYALDEIDTEMGFESDEALKNMIERAGKATARIKELEAIIRTQMTEKPVTLEKEVKDTSDLIKVRGEPLYTIEQIDALSGVVGEYLVNPNTINAYQVVRQYQALERARRFENVANRRKELIVTEGLSWEEAHNKAMDEFARGKLPTLTIEGLQGITDELRDVFFAKVHHTFDQLGNRYEGERWATITALTNALAGTSIPMDRGKGSLLFPEGGSAWDRLNYVFGKQPKLMEGLTKTAEQKQSLKDVVQGIFREVPEGGMPPIAIDQKTADYLRRLAEIPMGQARLGEKPFVLPSLPVDTRTPAQKAIDLQNFKLELTPALWKDWTPQRLEEMSYLRINLLKTEYQTKLAEAGWTPPSTIADQRTPAQRALDLDLFKIEMAIPPEVLAPTKYVFEAPIEDAIKQIPLLPRPAKDNVVRALKEIGMLPVDIGNFLRANKASFDFSFWRQQAPLIAGHPISFVQANIEAWKALWSQKSAEASWVKITRDPLYQIYEECERNGGDFIRPLELKKGTAQWRGVEEYGYLTGERVLPKLTAKIPWIKLSARSFETGTNVHNWLIFKNYYNAMLKYSEQIASGKKTLKVGEAFDISKEMVDFSKSLANFTARGSLGKFAVTAPELSGLFFAPRAAIGRILSVKDLVNANPRVRLEAWKNAATFVSTFGGLVLLGAAVGWWDVEKDPRSAEYMSIRIGNTRIDPWGGFRQFLVFFTRAITGTGVSSVTGAKYKTDPLGLIQNLLVGKASPLASTILDFWRGKNFVGEEVDVANKKQWVERVAPFALWDIYEAYQDDPIHVLQIAIPAIVGAGVQTYTGDWKDNFPKLGLPKYSDNLAYGLVEPKYDTSDLWTDTSSQFKGVDPATLTEAKGFPPYIKAIAESRIINEYLATLPSEKLVNLNADPSKGITFTQYYQMWRDRQAIVTSGDEEKLADFDKDERTRNANLGNFSQRQFALLNEYWSITDKNKQAEFLKLHQAEIGIKARDEYLRTHPKENAQLAVWGQADILTREAYTLFNTMIKSLDIPDSAIPPLTLPPETSIESHFTYKEMVSQGKQGSWEAQLLLKQDAIKAKDSGAQSYADWAGLKLSDTPMASLEIKTKPEFRELYDKIQDLSDRTSPDYIADDKARAEAIKKLKADNPNYVDDTRRIEAIEKGTDQSPIDDALITAHVAYGKLIDKEGIGSSSAEVMLYRVDEPSYNTWRMDANVWGDNALKPIDESRIPIWRIDVKYAKEDAAYDALPTTGTDREDYLTNNLEYRMDRRRREAYQKGLDAGLIEPYVSYCELPITGYRRDRFLLNNPDFANALKLTIPDIVPSEQYDILLEKKDRTPQDELRMDAYKLYVPDEQIENYVGWNTIIGEGRPKLRPGEKDAGYYEDNWWMMEHLDYYQQVYLNKNIYPDHQRMDFRKVPTKKVYAKYWTYLNELSEGKPREDYRRGNPDLEEWLLLTGKVTQSITEKARRAELSPAERLAEEVADRLKRIRELSEPLALK